MVQVMRALPDAVKQLTRDEAQQYLSFVNPAYLSAPGSDFVRLVTHFKTHNVLKMGSMSMNVVWNTHALTHLRFLLHSALRPSSHIESLVFHTRQMIHEFARRKGMPTTYEHRSSHAGT